MAVTIEPNKTIFETDDTDPIKSTLEETTKYFIAYNFPSYIGNNIIEMLKTCDFYNRGMYENGHFGKLTKVTVAYYPNTQKVVVGLEYGEYGHGQKMLLGKMNGGVLWNMTGDVKESIEYLATDALTSPRSFNGYKIKFTLQRANK